MFLNFFEDHRQHHLDPLTLTRPVDDLRLGILTIRDKWLLALQTTQWTRSTRDHIKDVFSTSSVDETPTIWINSRYLPTQDLISRITDLEKDHAIVNDNDVVAANSMSLKDAMVQSVEDLPQSITPQELPEDIQLDSCHHLWDLFLLNANQISSDLALLDLSPSTTVPNGIHTDDQHSLYIHDTATIEPGVTIITEGKPVYIGPNAHIMAGGVIRGPVAICEDSVIKMGAKIYGKTTIGPVCKVGGEINNCIFHSYSNKGHDGFVGNSLFGQWCNLGADTNTSNLKNNYSTVGVVDWTTGDMKDSGQQFVGTIMGDHSKTSINTMLNTGTVCGVSCNIFSSGFPPKHIPSFSWMGDGERQQYRFDKATETMERMMGRRDVPFTPEYQRMMQQVLVMETKRISAED